MAAVCGRAMAQNGKSAFSSPNFELVKLADGVYSCIRKEPASLWFNPNNTFIIGKKDVIVIDANISSAYTREVIAALRSLTNKPIKYVINTHWHEDHIIGNRAYREAYPGVKFIAQRSTLADLPTIGATNRKGSIEGGPGFVQLLHEQIAKGENLAGQKLTDEERVGYTSDAVLVQSYLDEAPKFEIIMPDILVDERMDLDQDGRKIEIIFLGRAHTGADLVVRLPKENIVMCGDLIVWPVPLVGSTSYPLEYGATLEKLLALKAKVILPGHGPVMRDDAYLRQMIGLLNSIKQQVEAAVARGETLEETRKSVNLEGFKKSFAGDSQHLRFVFANYVTFPAITAAYGQAVGSGKAKTN
jgi:cyclase